MNYSEALSFAFQDEEWLKKMAIGGLLILVSFYFGLIFIFGFFILGYYIGIMRNVIHDTEKSLPDWHHWSKLFIDGIMGAVILLIYFVIIGGLCALMIVSICTQAYFPQVEMVMSIVSVSLMTLFLLMFFTNFGLLQFALTDNFASAFDISALLRIIKNGFGHFLAIIIFSLILNAILLFAGLGFFSPFTNFWGLVVQGHLFGQCAKNCLKPVVSGQIA